MLYEVITASTLVASYARELASPGRTAVPLITTDVRVWFNPQLESKDFMIPGILALLLLVAADGANSTVRDLLGLGATRVDYERNNFV